MTKMTNLNELGYDSSRNAYLSELPDAIYWPFERLPESKLDAYAMACVEAALRYSEDAQQIYVRIVLSWELPGGQTLIGDFVRCKQDTRVYLRDRARAVVRNDCLPAYPDSWLETIGKAESNTDFHRLLKYVVYFILVGFNSKADIENQTLKVLPAKSPYLAQAISFCSVFDYLQIRPELKGPRVIPDSELTKFKWFCRTLTSNPTTRMSRQVRRRIIRTLRSKGFDLHHYQTILDHADQWYKCRVNPGTITAYLSELTDQHIILERGRVSNNLAPFDEAIGYPRQWRK